MTTTTKRMMMSLSKGLLSLVSSFYCVQLASALCVFIKITLVYPYMMINMYRSFGNIELSTEELSNLFIIYPIVNGVSRILWGTLIDIFSFKVLYCILIFLGVK